MGKKQKKKSQAAVSLGRKRWAGVSKEDRSQAMRELVLRRWNKRKK
ncbi:MAG: hypothetical protein O6929_04035 [candidate division NC10 bacterium]|nr:hypothetical protein [candidate division NC10 bacterium]